MEQSTDLELVQRAQRGDQAAFGSLVERHFGTVFGVAYARLGHREGAEDAAQEVFLRAYLHLGKLRNPDQFPHWVVRMARNIALDWLRTGNRRSKLLRMVPMDETVENTVTDERPSAARSMSDKEEAAAMQHLLESLSGEEREVVVLHFVEGLSKSEIARRTGVHPTTVGRQLDKSLARLRADAASADRAKSLAPRPAALRRAVAIVGVVAAMPIDARAAIVAASEVGSIPSRASLGSTLATAVQNFVGTTLPTLPSTLVKGAVAMGWMKTVSVVAVVVVASGFAYTRISSAANPAAIQTAQGNRTPPKSTAKFRKWPEVVRWGGEQKFDVPRGEGIDADITGGKSGLARGTMEALPDGTLVVTGYLDSGEVNTYRVGPSSGAVPASNVWVNFYVDKGGKYLQLESTFAEIFPDKTRAHWFTMARPDLAPAILGKMNEFRSGSITRDARNAALWTLLDQAGSLPADANHRAELQKYLLAWNGY
jgi:RNA polymerase sigma-70 factor (ECF subfamily)